MGSRHTRRSASEAEHTSDESSTNPAINEDTESDDNESDLVSVLAFLLRRWGTQLFLTRISISN